MTYLGSVEVFRCDYCGCNATVNSGLPKDWVWVKMGGPIKHACNLCKEHVPKEIQRKSGELN
jgi:hypothetical protein